MDELTQIKLIQRSKQSRAYVTGLHSTPAGMDAANLLLAHIKKTNSSALFILISFPDLEKLLSLGSFSALKSAWPAIARKLKKYLPGKSLVTQTQFGLFVQVWDQATARKLFDGKLKLLLREINKPFSLSNLGEGGTFSMRSYAGHLYVRNSSTAPNEAEALLSKLALAAESAKRSEEMLRHFTPRLKKVLARQEYMIQKLPRAIEEDAIQLNFQPVFASEKKTVTGALTHISWNDPKHGNIEGNELINISKLTGTMPALSRFILRRSMSFLNNDRIRNLSNGDFTLLVSVRNEVFHDYEFDLYREVKHSAAQWGLPLGSLCISLEGDSPMSPLQRCRKISSLKKLAQENCGICLNSNDSVSDLCMLARNVVTHIYWTPETQLSLNKNEQRQVLDMIAEFSKYTKTSLIVGNINSKDHLEILSNNKINMLSGSLFSEPLNESVFKSYVNYQPTQPIS